MVRILITGSRAWPAEAINEITQLLGQTIIGYKKDEITIVHGACPTGVDAMANWIAWHWGLAIEQHPADWSTYGRRAGFVRNAEMVQSGVDICLAFVYNKSKGASMTIDLCRKNKIQVFIIEKEGAI